MSTLFIEQVIDVVKVVLKIKNNGGTTTYYLGRRFYDANEIYSGSPVVYPLLSDSPVCVRSVGRQVAILHNVSVNIYGKNYLTKVGESFCDLIDSHDFVSSTVECRRYFRTRDGTTTHADGTNIRQTLEVTDFAWAGDILTLNCKDTWFKNKEISKRFTIETFPSMSDEWLGEYGGIVFGSGEGANGVPIDAPFYYTAVETSNPWRPVAKVFSGWSATSHPLNALAKIYTRNHWKDFNREEWTAFNLESDPQAIYIGEMDVGGSTAQNLQASAWGIAHAEATTPRLLSHIGAVLTQTGTISGSDGQLSCYMTYATYRTNAASFEPSGAVLSHLTQDPNDTAITVAGQGWFQFPQYTLVHLNTNYFFRLEWSNLDDAVNYMRTGTKATGGYTGYSRSNAEKVKGWVANGTTRLQLALYAAGYGDDAWIDLYSSSTAPYRYSYLHLESKQVNPTGSTQLGWNTSLELKIAVKGLEDDGSGTYTGSANAVITNPSDIIRFLLLEDEIGLGLASTAIDTTAFSNTRTSLSTTFNMSFAIDSRTDLQDIIPKICRQSRIIFYKTRAGKLALKYPTTIGPTYAAYWQETGMKHDLQIVAVLDTQNDTVINDILIPFGLDVLSTPKDPALIRKTGTSSYKAVEYLNGTSGSVGDSTRVTKAATSQTIYGRKEYRDNFDLFPADSAAPEKLCKYLFDRYHTKQKRVTARVPLVKHYARDFWDSVYLAHTDLPGQQSTQEDVTCNYDGTGELCYYEGVPTAISKQGNIAGEVVAIEETEDDMLITVETVNSYEV